MGYYATAAFLMPIARTPKTAYPRSTDCESGFRFLHPGMGRWISRDPIGERGGYNLTGFDGCDPIGSIDPLGLFTGSFIQNPTSETAADDSFTAGVAQGGCGSCYSKCKLFPPGLFWWMPCKLTTVERIFIPPSDSSYWRTTVPLDPVVARGWGRKDYGARKAVVLKHEQGHVEDAKRWHSQWAALYQQYELIYWETEADCMSKAADLTRDMKDDFHRMTVRSQKDRL